MYSNDLVCNIINYINQNIKYKINIQNIADNFYFNRFYIMKLFKKELGISINEYINKKRIYDSLTQIKNTNDSFLTVALDNGFNSLEYFSESFKNVIGTSPRTYKKFTYFIIKTTENQTDIIRKNLLKLQVLIEKIDKYTRNKKSENKKDKKLSIFW